MKIPVLEPLFEALFLKVFFWKMFLCDFCKIFQNAFFTEHLRATAAALLPFVFIVYFKYALNYWATTTHRNKFMNLSIIYDGTFCENS